MNINLLPFAVLWAILATVVIALVVYRKRIASQEDDTLHVMDGDARLVPRQQIVAHKLETVDRWGKILTVLAVVYGLVVAAGYIYQNWVHASNDMWH